MGPLVLVRAIRFRMIRRLKKTKLRLLHLHLHHLHHLLPLPLQFLPLCHCPIHCLYRQLSGLLMSFRLPSCDDCVGYCTSASGVKSIWMWSWLIGSCFRMYWMTSWLHCDWSLWLHVIHAMIGKDLLIGIEVGLAAEWFRMCYLNCHHDVLELFKLNHFTYMYKKYIVRKRKSWWIRNTCTCRSHCGNLARLWHHDGEWLNWTSCM